MGWHYVCLAAEVPEATSREFLVNARVLAVFQHAQDQWCAMDGMCAHQGGPIAQGKLDGTCVTCPWHGWQYDITNGRNVLTGKQMLDCFEIERRGEEIWVRIE
jgi:nitrite reductase (NADH) small subunit